MIGSLMYLITGIRPNPAYPIWFLTQFSSCPTDQHIKVAKHIFRYVYTMRKIGLFYSYTTPNAIGISSDTDSPGYHVTRRSTSSYIPRFNNCCVSCLSNKQVSIDKSTTKRELLLCPTGPTLSHVFKKALVTCAFVLRCLSGLIILVDISWLWTLRSMFEQKNVTVDFFIPPEALANKLFFLLTGESVNNVRDIWTRILAKPVHYGMVGLLDCR